MNISVHHVRGRAGWGPPLIYASAATVAATSYTTPDGQQANGRYTDCWAKHNGKWLAVSAHVTR